MFFGMDAMGCGQGITYGNGMDSDKKEKWFLPLIVTLDIYFIEIKEVLNEMVLVLSVEIQ